MAADLVIKNGMVLTMDPAFTVLENADVEITGSRISRVSRCSAPEAKSTIDATGMLVMPGLINCHTHAAMTLMRGLADDMALDAWWQKFIFPIERKLLSPDLVRAGTALAALEMLKSGTTCFADMYFFEGAAAEACKQVGIRAFLGEGVLDFPTPDSACADEALRTTESLIAAWRGDPLVRFIIAPHALYSCGEKSLRACKAVAERSGSMLQIHVAETAKEVADSIERHGQTPIEYLESLGLLDETVMAVHCVHATEKDLLILAEHAVKVVHCPESNMKLASGIAPVPDMLAGGITVGLGTDGAASNNDLDLRGEMDSAAKIHKVSRLDPTVMNAREVLGMATFGAARALGRPDLGSIEEGKTADIILVNLRQPQLTPLYNIYSQLVYSASGSEVGTVVIDGRVVVKDGCVLTVDADAIMDQANRIAGTIRDEAYG